ncbi:unnamed protein product [Mesocestoides corti]|uniref:Uncharacterized protein n=1 Tax=Mesocestoides corti TaxID=53468 RepID=A0A0R3UFU5_MESCO|nr:unnamed protein product [Mesocestoides corti]
MLCLFQVEAKIAVPKEVLSTTLYVPSRQINGTDGGTSASRFMNVAPSGVQPQSSSTTLATMAALAAAAAAARQQTAQQRLAQPSLLPTALQAPLSVPELMSLMPMPYQTGAMFPKPETMHLFSRSVSTPGPSTANLNDLSAVFGAALPHSLSTLDFPPRFAAAFPSPVGLSSAQHKLLAPLSSSNDGTALAMASFQNPYATPQHAMHHYNAAAAAAAAAAAYNAGLLQQQQQHQAVTLAAAAAAQAQTGPLPPPPPPPPTTLQTQAAAPPSVKTENLGGIVLPQPPQLSNNIEGLNLTQPQSNQPKPSEPVLTTYASNAITTPPAVVTTDSNSGFWLIPTKIPR